MFHSAKSQTPQKENGRSSGGIALGFTTTIKQGIKLISHRNNFLWTKLDKTFLHIEKDIFLCAVYIPPRDSPYFNPDIFDELQNDITKFSSKGFGLLEGDFNARTGCAQDFIDIDQCIHIPGDNFSPKHDLRRRKNYDHQINDHGQSLLEICKMCDLRIVNGRTTWDSWHNNLPLPGRS